MNFLLLNFFGIFPRIFYKDKKGTRYFNLYIYISPENKLFAAYLHTLHENLHSPSLPLVSATYHRALLLHCDLRRLEHIAHRPMLIRNLHYYLWHVIKNATCVCLHCAGRHSYNLSCGNIL